MTTVVLRPQATIADARRTLAQAFMAAGLDRPDLDARVLVQHALGLDHAELAVAADRPLSKSESQRLAGFATRRVAGEPVARIIGTKEFWGLALAITAATLLPRPDTETVVEAALAAIGDGGARTRSLRIADLGTGSGALLLALLTELPNAVGVGTDVSYEALVTAADNARRLSLRDRASFVACDFGTSLTGGFDLVVSNPPYVESGAIAGLAPEVRDHDPHLALDGGSDGLAAYRAIGDDAHRLLAPQGHLIVEIGAGQGWQVKRILTAAGLEVGTIATDLAGIARAVSALR